MYSETASFFTKHKNKMINLKNKKVTVMGLGLYENGSGISATRFLLGQGAKLTVTDLKTYEQLEKQIKSLGQAAKKIKFVLGGHQEDDFKNADLILKNPGVPRNSKFLQIAKERHIPIETDISLFFQIVDPKRIIGITGTRGKSTTATLTFEIIKTKYKNSVLGGNITKSPLAQMDEIKKGGLIILELSSWMLESLEEHKLSPHISIFTNIYPDHLNTYSSIEEYSLAKENIFQWQDKNDYIILNRNNKFTFKAGKRAPSKRYWFSTKEFKEENGIFVRGNKVYFRKNEKEEFLIKIDDIKIPGKHNLENVLPAVCVAKLLGISKANITKAVKNFRGVHSRLELIKEVGGVRFYNDTTSTTPEAGIAGLRALSNKKKNIILIAGGSDKGLEFIQLVKEIKKVCKAVVFLKGSGTDKLEKYLNGCNLIKAETTSMADAVGVAKSFSKRGDIVLLSPACASFGLFNNEFDRGDQFNSAVRNLK